VPDDGPAANLLQAEDVIVALDDRIVGYTSELQAQVAERRPGDRVRLTVFRDGSPIDVTVRLGEAPINGLATAVAERELVAEERLGIQVEALDSELAARLGFAEATGVVLMDVAPGSAAQRRGVGGMVQTRLERINDIDIETPADVRRALDAVGPGEIVSLHFTDRTGASRVINVRMP